MAAPAILIEKLTFTYRGATAPALRGVSLRVEPEELVVVMGPTGAGKSTLAKCLNRTVPCFQAGDLSGHIAVLGQPLDGLQVADLAGKVGLVLQDFEAQLFATDVVQEVAFGLEQLGVPPAEMADRIAGALAAVGLSGFESRDPTTLSGGEKQRLAIAAVLAMSPPVLLLDEPTTDLDPLGKSEVFQTLAALRRQGHTILLIEHEIEAAEVADRLVLMDAGQIIAEGPPGVLLRDAESLRRNGVRPRDVDRIALALGLPPEVRSADDVARVLRGGATARAAPPPAARESRAPAAVSVRGASFAYPGGRRALEDIDLELREGDFVALVGQNGSGKTTLAKLLNGLLRPQRGRVELWGTDVRRLPLARIAGLVGYVFQDPDQQLFASTVREEVAFGPRNLGVAEPELCQRIDEALEAVGLADSRDADPFLLTKGERQRLAVAAMLAQRPRLLILDEPTTGLDYREQVRMMELVARLHGEGMTMVVITHSPWVVAEYAQRGILMAGGRIVFDGPLRELFRQEELLERCHFRVPEVTRIANRLGWSALSVEELLAAVQWEAKAASGSGPLPSGARS